jgi:hypothetical protein
MTIIKFNARSDGYMWRCSKCRRTKSLRDGSIFARANGPIQVYFALLYMWVHDFDNRHAERELQLDDKTVTSWFATFREYLSREPTGKIGGEGVLVEFDQTCLTHQKHHRGKKKPGTQVSNSRFLLMNHCIPLSLVLVLRRGGARSQRAVFRREG